MKMSIISLNNSVVVVQSLCRVRLIATPWTAVCQASLSFTISRSLLQFMSIELVMPSNHLILCCLLLLLLCSIFLSIKVFSNDQLFAWGGQSIGASASASVLPMNIPIDFLYDWLFWSCSPRDSQESSSTPQLKASILGCSAFFAAQLSHP